MARATRTAGTPSYLLSNGASRHAFLLHCQQYWVCMFSKHPKPFLKDYRTASQVKQPGDTEYNEGSLADQHFVRAGRNTCTCFIVSGEEAQAQTSWTSSCRVSFNSLPSGSYNPTSSNKISNLHSMSASEAAPSCNLADYMRWVKEPSIWRSRGYRRHQWLQSLQEHCF